jgi:hypothetical protein
MNPSGDQKTCVDRAPSLTVIDAAALLICWAGASAVTYSSNELAVALVAIVAAYYMAKWIILKHKSD